MGAFSIWHIVVIAIVAAFLFFGWKQLPDMARSFGRSLRVFKTEIKGMTDDDSARESARESAGDSAGDDKPAAPAVRQVEAPAQRPDPAPARLTKRVEMVPNRDVADSRPRPTPSPNGRPRA